MMEQMIGGRLHNPFRISAESFETSESLIMALSIIRVKYC